MIISLSAFLTHLAFAAAIFILWVALTWFMMRRVQILDMPGERSSHTRPVPKSGGVAIVAAFALAALVIYFVAEIARIDDRHFWGFLVTALLLATVSFVDDINQKSFFAKVATQTLCVNAVAVAQGQGAFALVELEPPQQGSFSFPSCCSTAFTRTGCSAARRRRSTSEPPADPPFPPASLPC